MLVFSLVATGFLAFGLWVHHMFATGIPQMAEIFINGLGDASRVPKFTRCLYRFIKFMLPLDISQRVYL